MSEVKPISEQSLVKSVDKISSLIETVNNPPDIAKNIQVEDGGSKINEPKVPSTIESLNSVTNRVKELCTALDPIYFSQRYQEQQQMELTLAERVKVWPLINGYFGNIQPVNQSFSEKGDIRATQFPFGELLGSEKYVNDIIDSLLSVQDRVVILEIGAGRAASLINIGFVKQDLVNAGRLVLGASSLEPIPETEEDFKTPYMSKSEKEFLIRNRHLVHFLQGGRNELLNAKLDVSGENMPLAGNINLLIAQNSFETWSLVPGYDFLSYGALLNGDHGVYLTRGQPISSVYSHIIGDKHPLSETRLPRDIRDRWLNARKHELLTAREGVNPLTGKTYSEEILGLRLVIHPEVGGNQNDTLSYITHRTTNAPLISVAN